MTLRNFDRAGEGGEEGSSAAGVTIAEGLAARVERSPIRIANVEVARQGMSASTKPLTEFLQCATRLIMKISNRAVAVQLPNPQEVITSWENVLMLERSTWSQDYLSESG